MSEANCGISVEPENSEKTSAAVIQLLNLSDNDKKIMGKNGHQYCLNNHDYKVLSDRFIKAIISA